MENDRHRTAVAAVALVATMAIIVAMFLTVKAVDTRGAKVDALRAQRDWPDRIRH
jgi:ethanolamine transporter EutH